MRTEREPRASDITLPVYIPSTDGAMNVEMGKGSLKHGTLVIEFKNTLPGVAIQRMLERGVILGISFVMIAPDDLNLAAQERLEKINQDTEDLDKLKNDDVSVEDIMKYDRDSEYDEYEVDPDEETNEETNKENN